MRFTVATDITSPHFRGMRTVILGSTALIGLCALLTVGGTVSAATSPEPEKAVSFYEDAQRLAQRGDHRAAIVQMRNAVQLDPQNLQYRRVLGELYLSIGDAASAEKELFRAQERRPDDGTEVLLGRALLFQGKFDKVIQVVAESAGDPGLREQEALLLGQARLALGETEAARGHFEAALATNPASTLARLGLAQHAGVTGDRAAAGMHLKAVLAADPRNVDAWLLTSHLAEQDLRLGDALDALARARDVSPADPRVDMAEIQVLIRAQRPAEALTRARALAERHGAHAPVQQALAMALAANGHYEEADRAFVQVEERVPPTADGLILGALIKYRTGQYAQAERYLLRLLDLVPGNREALRSLAELHLKQGNTTGAIQVLESHAEDADPASLGLLASAYLRDGQVGKAAELFERIAASGPTPEARQAQASLSLLAGGLEAGNGKKSDEDANRLTLLAADKMRAGDVEGSKADLERLRQMHPDAPLYPALLGQVLAQSGDLTGARAAYEAALKLDPDFPPALDGLVRVLRAGGDKAVLETVLREGLTAGGGARWAAHLGGVLDEQGKQAEAIRILEDAIRADGSALEPRMMLVEVHGRARNAAAVRQAVEDMVGAAPEDPKALEAAGRSYAALNDWAGAEKHLRTLLKIAPDHVQGHVLLAEALAGQKKRPDAVALLTAFDKRQPGRPAILTALAEHRLSAGDVAGARAAVASLEARDPITAARLDGRILGRTGKAAEAVARVAAAFERHPVQALAADLYVARLAAGDRNAALTGLKDWLARNPADHGMRQMLANHYLGDDDPRNAEIEYRRVVAALPNDVVSLNNLAWLRYRQNGADALDFARRAHALAPNDASVLDTLGTILIGRGDLREGLVHLRRAAQLDPANSEITLNFARALIRDGQPAEARNVLTAVLRGRADDPRRGEAQDLLSQLEHP